MRGGPKTQSRCSAHRDATHAAVNRPSMGTVVDPPHGICSNPRSRWARLPSFPAFHSQPSERAVRLDHRRRSAIPWGSVRLEQIAPCDTNPTGLNTVFAAIAYHRNPVGVEAGWKTQHRPRALPPGVQLTPKHGDGTRTCSKSVLSALQSLSGQGDTS